MITMGTAPTREMMAQDRTQTIIAWEVVGGLGSLFRKRMNPRAAETAAVYRNGVAREASPDRRA